MMVAGTSSKWVGKGSRPKLRASSQARSIESRNRSISVSAMLATPDMQPRRGTSCGCPGLRSSCASLAPGHPQEVPLRVLACRNSIFLGKELAQRRVNLFLVRDGDGGEFLVVHFF